MTFNRETFISPKAFNNYCKIISLIFLGSGFLFDSYLAKCFAIAAAGIIIFYILDVVYDIKTLEERLNDNILFPSRVKVGGEDFKCVAVVKMKDVMNEKRFVDMTEIDATRVFKAGNEEYVSYYRRIKTVQSVEKNE